MGASLLAFNLSTFLNGSVFGYLLHAAEILLAQVLFGLHLKYRKHLVLRAIFSTILYLGLSVGLGIFFEKFFPYARFLIAFLLSVLAYIFCCESNVWDILFCCVAAVAMQNLAYSAGAFVVGAFGHDPVTVDLLYTSIFTVIYIGVHVACFMICARRLKKLNGGFGKERGLMVMVSLILTVVVYIIQHDRQTITATDFLLWRAVFISFDLLSLFMLFGMFDRSELRRENEVLDTLRANAEQQYEYDKRAIEMVNIKCHDLKHQLIALRGMAGEEQERALKDVEEAVMIYDSIAKTGSKPLDVILSNKYLLCEKYGIHFTYMVDGEQLVFMSSVDIYALFGNAIDNAIRAVRGIADKERRLINLTVTARGKLLLIHIENSIDGEVAFKDGLPVTTKNDKENHGFGMISMKRIAENYGGVMSVECTENMFCLDMTIPIREKA